MPTMIASSGCGVSFGMSYQVFPRLLLTLPLRRLNIDGLALFTTPGLPDHAEKTHVIGDLPDTASKIGE
jgi:hypothetical protein